MELHIILDASHLTRRVTRTLYETIEEFKAKRPLIITTQTHFISTQTIDAGYRLYVHQGKLMVEVPYRYCKAAQKDIRRCRDLERLKILMELWDR